MRMSRIRNWSTPQLSTLISVVVVGVLMFWGGWARRWMSDDGLIVLRTVRNLLAGNGPVFNVGERVEASTSTLWQYIIYLCALISGADIHLIALGASLILSVLALMVGAYATAVRYRDSAHLLVPFGALIYIALPPARDFATSGLEWGLSIFYLAVMWWLSGTKRTYLFAFWLGIGWLIRPEMLLYSAIFGLWLLYKATDWSQRWKIIAVAVPVPLGYEVFRMGYYGLLVPHTAVAKSASSSDWAGGLSYLWDLVSSYGMYLLLPVVAVLVVGLERRGALMIACGLLHAVYVIKVGGDFMHGRMLLLPLFALLLPIMVVPVTKKNGWAAAAVAVWALGVTLHGHTYERPTGTQAQTELGIVDEREYWTQTLHRDTPPRHASHFLSAPALRNFDSALDKGHATNGAYLVNYVVDKKRDLLSWAVVPRDGEQPLALMHLNLGMTSMNAGLDVRVHDTVGLSTPLAARQPKIDGGRIGHNKQLPLEWDLADSSADLNILPKWVDKEETRQVREMLQSGDAAELMASYKEPMSVKRFVKNMKFAVTTGLTLQFDGASSGDVDHK
ncbi:arabinofuranosyltrasnferase [Corynebacterium diphtheriae C7 (beta)]|nr:arabinofuranosyltrasnferase [Corynebacterium diphtheriae C7 (beta)]WJY88403.1 hypothetical protein CDIPH_10750 [Corynebacterium diphtheriae]CAB0621339.1 arabinofuranosyl transferase C [Corynebacterium diphtheriae]CAB0919420.1 arabinofuranosyl transferase C [Corynebacterium diphtheriae]CAB1012723.1 arabinofuranosyl transferase C [Corynebacterium diphtheriae]